MRWRYTPPSGCNPVDTEKEYEHGTTTHSLAQILSRHYNADYASMFSQIAGTFGTVHAVFEEMTE